MSISIGLSTESGRIIEYFALEECFGLEASQKLPMIQGIEMCFLYTNILDSQSCDEDRMCSKVAIKSS